MNADLIASLRLIRSPRIGPKTYRELLMLYGTAEAALEAVPHMATRSSKGAAFTLVSEAAILQEIEATQAFGAVHIHREHAHYPALLKYISDAPPVLIALGNTELLQREHAVAMVGARNASANACSLASTWAEALGKAQHVVVSGMARGIDTAAHKGALTHGTIAVLGGGIDHIYPRENTGLYENVRQEGLILSELPIGAVPRAEHFPRRNRIISGISQGTIVVEAAKRSGSLITARMALEQNREVMAVPGFPLDPRAGGTNYLIQQGARLVSSPQDVLDALAAPEQQPVLTELQEADSDFAAIEANTLPDENTLKEARALVENTLHSTPTAMDEIIRSTALPTHMVRIILLEMELSGQLERHPGDKVSLVFSA